MIAHYLWNRQQIDSCIHHKRIKNRATIDISYKKNYLILGAIFSIKKMFSCRAKRDFNVRIILKLVHYHFLQFAMRCNFFSNRFLFVF